MYGENGEYPAGIFILQLALIVLAIVGMWKLFEKAGKPGWTALIPIYNSCMLIDIAGKPIWWILLMVIPVVNIVIAILVMVGLAQNFGRGVGTALGLIFFPFLFLMILGFGSAEFNPAEVSAL